jgi:hypothetical protein
MTILIIPIREPFLGDRNYRDISLLSISLISYTSTL